MSIRDLFTLATRPSGTLAAATAPSTERGYTGAPSWGGERLFGSETDVNTIWRPPARYETARKMRAHPTTNAAIDAIVLALLSRDLKVVPGSEDPEDVGIAEFFENDLHNMSNMSLFDWRFEYLSESLWFGAAPYQTVFAMGDDGLWHLRKAAYRPAATIVRWPKDDHGGPAGIVQLDDNGQEVHFEMDELLVFTHRRVGGDLTGTPLSRRMYAPWYVLEQLYRIGPAAIERHGMGIPTMRGMSDTADEVSRIERVLMGIRANALSFVRLASGQAMDDFEIKGLTGSVIDPLPMMEYMRREIFLSTFTQGQVLGSDGVGSLALGETHLDMLMIVLRAIGRMETDTLNRHLIPRWVGYNWSGVPESRLPRIEVSEPEASNVAEFFAALLAGTQAGIRWDPELVRRRAHDELGIPLPDEAETVQDGGETDGTEAEQGAARRVFAAAGPKREPLRSEIALDALGIAPNFARMAGAYEEAEQRILKAATAVQRRQIANLLNRAREIVAAKDPALVASTEIRFTDELEAQLREVLAGLYADGAAEMADELDQQGVKAPAPDAERKAEDGKLLAAMAGVTALLLADRLRRSWSSETLRQVRAGSFDKVAMQSLLGALSDKAILDAARADTTVAVAAGRKAAGEAAGDVVDHYLVSAVLDTNTCAPCRDLDGAEVAPADAGSYAPNVVCEGGDRCRCVLIPVVART